jgi:uncharacterized cupredoxin-like copper-binding protein
MPLKTLAGFPLAALLILSPAALAHEGHAHKGAKAPISKEVHPWGQEGDPARARRTVTIDMADNMRFTPDKLTVEQGATVKFLIRNGGKLMHEMVIGTEAELVKHAEHMKTHPGMEHDSPYMAHVKPGASGELTWTFSKPGTFRYGCFEPGHWEAGMKGEIVVREKSP